MKQPSATDCTRPLRSLPLTLVVALAVAAWVPILVGPRPTPTLVAVARPAVAEGHAPALMADIRSAPRALVYVDCPVSIDAIRGRAQFDAAVRELTGAGIEFFVLADEVDPRTEAWLLGLGDDRVAPLGHACGAGGVLWLEYGRAADADPYAGVRLSAAGIVRRTRALWAIEAEPGLVPDRAGGRR